MITKAVLYVTLALSAALLLDVLPVSVQAQSLAASDAATQSAQAKLAAATAAQNAGRKKYPVTREDIVVAMPVDQAHLTVAHASRVWRKVIVLPLVLTRGLHALQFMSSYCLHELTHIWSICMLCCALQHCMHRSPMQAWVAMSLLSLHCASSPLFLLSPTGVSSVMQSQALVAIVH